MQIMTVARSEADKVYVTVKNDTTSAAVLEPGKVVVWQATTTDADQGYTVTLPISAINVTTGIAAKVAGVVDSTINTAAVGRIQVYGVANVRASASLDLSRMVVTGTNNATNRGHVFMASQSTLTSPEYTGAIVGWTLENGPNATNSTVFLSCL